jgi:hypothetical protein
LGKAYVGSNKIVGKIAPRREGGWKKGEEKTRK